MINSDLDWTEKAKRERQVAQEILNDPNSDQLARDLAHLRLQQQEEEIAYGDAIETMDVPEEWMTVEAVEAGLTSLPDVELIKLVEDPLLQNKCKTLRSIVLPNGTLSVIEAYPKLTRAARNLMTNGPQMAASANAVLACLLRGSDFEESISYFLEAIRLRPNDWRLRNAIAASYMPLGKTSLALEALTKAVKLSPKDSFERFEIEECRSKVLYQLGRVDEAKACMSQVLQDRDKFKDRMSPLDFGHTIVMEYFLCTVYAEEKNKIKVKELWDGAEEKRIALPPDIRQRISWDSRNLAQLAMAGLDTSLLSHQECHHCRKLVKNPKQCSRCKSALYCSPECQLAAWKSGHKQECNKAKEMRKEQKKEKKETEKKKEAVRRLPPLDANLDPHSLWGKAKARTTDCPLDAVFYFTVALFLDFSLDANDLSPAKAAVDAAPSDHPVTLALHMITHMDKSRPLAQLDSNRIKAIDYISSPMKYDTCETFEQIDRSHFGLAMCCVFQARLMGRCYAVRSPEQAQDPSYRRAFETIVKLINDAASHLECDRWLTMQFECGYSNLDVGAVDEGKRWLEMFVNNLGALEKKNGGKLSKHWKAMRKRARQRLKLVPLLQRHAY